MAESVKSAERALRIIELLTVAGATEFTEIAARLDLPKSSAHYLLATMRDGGFLDFDAGSRRYTVGPRLWEAGQAYIRDLDVARLARPHLELARDELGETVQLAVLDGLDNVYVGKAETDHALQLVSKIGSRLPAYATGLGKVLLAGLAPEEFERRLDGTRLERFTPTTITDLEELRRELARIRRRGYALDRGEYASGVFCIAAPIDNAVGTIAAMSVSIPNVRVTPAVRRSAIDSITGRARELSAQLSTRRADG
jgi:IclR family KDG regulon transcriptional repressor